MTVFRLPARQLGLTSQSHASQLLIMSTFRSNLCCSSGVAAFTMHCHKLLLSLPRQCNAESRNTIVVPV